MARPVVGITTYEVDEVSFGPWKTPAALIPRTYVRAIERSGGRPLLVPPLDDAVDETLDVLDGILFSGGEDVDPAAYGAEAHPETRGVNPERDRGELVLLRAALARDMPVLAVCRGSQLLNVALGGDLVQHLPEALGHDDHRHTPGVFGDHEVELREEGRLKALLGERAPVKSHHHQGFGRLGDGVVATAWADDGTVEGLELPAQRFALGVLWHPEEGEDAALFEALVEEARGYRARRAAGGEVMA